MARSELSSSVAVGPEEGFELSHCGREHRQPDRPETRTAWSSVDSSALATRGAAHRMAWRAALIGALVFVAAWLITDTRLYATTALVLLIAGVVAADLRHLIERTGLTGPPGRDASAVASLARQRSMETQRQIEHLHSLLDTVSAALMVVQPDGRITLANRAARRLVAQPVERLADVAAIGPSAARTLLELPPGGRSIVSLAHGGRVFVSVSRFKASERESLRLLAIQRIAGELDAVELEAWHEMAHVLAHEMMNSLTPIASLSESLERLLMDATAGDTARGAPDSNVEIRAALEAIRRRSTGLMDFVERYRTVSDLPRPVVQAVRLDGLLSGVGRLFSARFAERQIAYRTSIAPDDLTVSADPQLLEQAIINLLRNAADAVDGVARPCIDVACRTHDGYVIINVADNGCGIPEEGREQVFVPFFTTKPGGSGIGLSLTRQIALSHGGKLELRGNQPEGSVFALILPATIEPQRS
jgi:two-component system, NtrC family, nitrogen regulation sensor histidine kinase NtrY